MILAGLRFAIVDHKQHQVGLFDCLCGPTNAFFFDVVSALSQARCIGQLDRYTGYIDRRIDHITCGAWGDADDSPIFSRQCIHQA